MEEEVSGHGVQTAMETQVRVERAHELGVTLVVGERSEHPVGELADVALGSPENERVWTELLEQRDAALAALRPSDDHGLLRLEKREVRSGGSALRTADPGGERLVAALMTDAPAQMLRMRARVDRSGHLAERDDDPARSQDTRPGDDLGHGDAKSR